MTTLQLHTLATHTAPGALDALLRELAGMAAAAPRLRWIKASHGRELRLIDVDEVLYFQADAKYTRVVTADSDALIRTPLRQLEAALDPSCFWAIHRSTIVNARSIAGVARDGRGRVAVRLKSRPERLTVSEAHEHLFKQM